MQLYDILLRDWRCAMVGRKLVTLKTNGVVDGIHLKLCFSSCLLFLNSALDIFDCEKNTLGPVIRTW